MLSRLVITCLVAGGRAAIKCNGRIPLQFGGFDLYCGVGAPACPIGSFCHMDDDGFGRFAVCCPNFIPSFSLSFGSSLPQGTPLYAANAPANAPLYIPPLYIPGPGICPDGKPKLSCPINSCLTSDCLGVPGASCMVDYCDACAPKWFGLRNEVLSADQCNWMSAWIERLQQSFAPRTFVSSLPAIQQPAPQQPAPQQVFTQDFTSISIQPLPIRCSPAPDCGLEFLNSSDKQSSDTQQAGDTPAEKQERVWQEQAQKTSCHYENPQKAPNGCLMGCGTLICNGPVRFLEIAMGQGSAVATWVPPLSAALGQTYVVEMSYDGQTWRNLPLEQPWATFARFQVDEGKPFLLRVTARGYPSAVKQFDFGISSTASEENLTESSGVFLEANLTDSSVGVFAEENSTESSVGVFAEAHSTGPSVEVLSTGPSVEVPLEANSSMEMFTEGSAEIETNFTEP
jgi:hypothetical protein